MMDALIASLELLPPDDPVEALRQACAVSPGADCRILGHSEEGRPIPGVVIGDGELTVSLVAGAHADEPIGPALLRTICGHPEVLLKDPELSRFRFVIVPHVNPDSEARNRTWMERWPDPAAYLASTYRELPGRDVEFGYPDMRIENRITAAFLREHGPYVLHASLHGMGFADGAMLLIERHWGYRTRAMQRRWAAAAVKEGLTLHDLNRQGEKGFFYLGPGFMTTPEGEAMSAFFRSRGDASTARLFHQSSMEYVRSLGGDPLCLVSEVPLFLVNPREPRPGHAAGHLAIRDSVPGLRMKLATGTSIGEELDSAGVRPVAPAVAARLQWEAIRLGLRQVSGALANEEQEDKGT